MPNKMVVWKPKLWNRRHKQRRLLGHIRTGKPKRVRQTPVQLRNRTLTQWHLKAQLQLLLKFATHVSKDETAPSGGAHNEQLECRTQRNTLLDRALTKRLDAPSTDQFTVTTEVW